MFWALLAFMMGATGACTAMRDKTSRFLGALGSVAGCGLTLYAAFLSLAYRRIETRIIEWNFPFGSFNLGLDSLTAIWIMPAAAVMGLSALSAYRQPPGEYAANHPREHWFLFNAILAAILLAALSRNGVLLLFAWGVLLSAAFLFARGNRPGFGCGEGGAFRWAAAYLGWCSLLAAVLTAGGEAESLNFQSVNYAGARSIGFWLFVWAGFSAVLGLFPFCGKYADAFAASSGPAAVISGGVFPALGCYAVVRLATLAGLPPPRWWGILIASAGAATGVFAAVKALVEKDLTRVLAWSILKNSGVVAVCLGLGFLHGGGERLFAGDFATAALLMANHVMSGGLLFLAGENVRHMGGSRNLDRLGGLFPAMPATGAFFLLGSLWAALLPPFSGFPALVRAFEVAAASAAMSDSTANVLLFCLVGAALAGSVILGAIALARAFSMAFLGSPRNRGAYPAKREPPSRLVAPLGLSAAGLYLVFAIREAFPLLAWAMLLSFVILVTALAAWRFVFWKKSGAFTQRKDPPGRRAPGRGHKDAPMVRSAESVAVNVDGSGGDGPALRPAGCSGGWLEGFGLDRAWLGAVYFACMVAALWIWAEMRA